MASPIGRSVRGCSSPRRRSRTTCRVYWRSSGWNDAPRRRCTERRSSATDPRFAAPAVWCSCCSVLLFVGAVMHAHDALHGFDDGDHGVATTLGEVPTNGDLAVVDIDVEQLAGVGIRTQARHHLASDRRVVTQQTAKQIATADDADQVWSG